MDYDRIRNFILSYSKDDEGILHDIYEKAVRDNVPIIRRESRDFLRVLIRMIKPERILEIGTAVGYSTLVMAETLFSLEKKPSRFPEWRIDTYELDPVRVKEASKNISLYSKSIDQMVPVRFFEGDAAELLDNVRCIDEAFADELENESIEIIDKRYDFVFIDAAKAQYQIYLEEALSLSHPGTVILCDNILADGDVLESHFLVEKRDRTIHDRMRDYLHNIMNDDRLDTSILSIADGMSLSVVR